jgi:hypothetical protein
VHRPLILLIAFSVGLCFLGSSGSAISRAHGSCLVTSPRPAAQGGLPFNYGNAHIRVQLLPKGHLIAGRLPDGGSWATINPDGSITAKLGWWRGVPGTLVIRGQRIDRQAPPLQADIPPTQSYGETGVIPSGLTFPSVGCWRIEGAQGGARITFVVKVTEIKRRG